MKNKIASEGFNSDSVIVGGDFNSVMDDQLDKKGGGIQNKSSVRNEIESIKSSFDLYDVWRIKNPTAKRHTWRQKKPLVQCRLDFWLISDELYDYVKESLIFCAPNTDHSAITLSFESIENEHQGRGYWKFNNSIVGFFF